MHYVKFLRLTSEAYKRLRHKDDDTLYFVYEEDELTAELYLGNKLIAGATAPSGEGVMALKDLQDVNIYDISDKNILMYSGLYDAWINAPAEEAISVFIGANEIASGKAGLVPAPEQGSNSSYLSSNGKWENISLSLEELKEIISKEAK